MRSSRKLIMPLLAGFAVLTACPAAADATGTSLPIASEYQIVADTAHGHLFISQGASNDTSSDNSILVTNLNGKPVATIGGQSGVEGMTLSPDGSTLYAALSAGDAVTAISTATLKQTASYPLGMDSAYSVAVQSGRIWVSYRDPRDFGAIGEIDPASANSFTPNALPPPEVNNWYPYAPWIATDPSDTGVLVAASVGVTPPSMMSYNISDPAAVSTLASTTSTYCEGPDLAVLPGGKAFLCGGSSFSTASFSLLSYFSSYSMAAVAPDGAIAVADGYTGQNQQNLSVYPPSSTASTAAYSLGGLLNSLLVDFTWSADGTQLFAVVATTNNGSTSYTVIALDPFRGATRLTLTSSAKTVGYDRRVTVTSHLGTTYTNRTISIYAKPAGKARKLLKRGKVSARGELTVRHAFTRDTTVAAVFTGDPLHTPRTVKRRIRVRVKLAAVLRGYVASRRIGGTRYRVYHRLATLRDSVRVTPDKRGECVRLYVQRHRHGAWHAAATVSCRRLTRRSQVTMRLKVRHTGRFRMRARFVRAKADAANISTSGSWQYYKVTR